MAFKLIAFATLVAAASAGLVPAPQVYHSGAYAYAAPVVTKVLTKSYEPEPYDHNPAYSYSYDVHDSLTGDVKSQHETRNGDNVEGSYSLIEADGSRRVVHYTADEHNGFNAVVEKQPAQVAVKAVVQPIAVKTVAQPIAVKTLAHPVAVKTVAYQAAPAAYHVAPAYTHATYAAAAPAYTHATYAAAAPSYSHTTYSAAVPVAHGYAAPALAHSYYH